MLFCYAARQRFVAWLWSHKNLDALLLCSLQLWFVTYVCGSLYVSFTRNYYNNNNKISRVPIYHTRWEHRALYKSTHNTHTYAHTHRHTHTHTRIGQGARHGCEKNSLEIVIKQVHLEGSFKRGVGQGYMCILQELCESRGGHPGLSVLMSLLVSMDVKLYWTMLWHWPQLVPNMSTDIWGH